MAKKQAKKKDPVGDFNFGANAKPKKSKKGGGKKGRGGFGGS